MLIRERPQWCESAAEAREPERRLEIVSERVEAKPYGSEFEPAMREERQALAIQQDGTGERRRSSSQLRNCQPSFDRLQLSASIEVVNLVAHTVASSNPVWDSNRIYAWLHEVAALRQAA